MAAVSRLPSALWPSPRRFALLLALFGLAAAAYWWLRMHHILHVHNAGSTEFTMQVLLGNQPSVHFERRLGPGDSTTIQFQKDAESGYIFYDVRGSVATELGRCGYTDKRVNEYRISLCPGTPFECTEISRGGPYPLP